MEITFPPTHVTSITFFWLCLQLPLPLCTMHGCLTIKTNALHSNVYETNYKSSVFPVKGRARSEAIHSLSSAGLNDTRRTLRRGCSAIWDRPNAPEQSDATTEPAVDKSAHTGLAISRSKPTEIPQFLFSSTRDLWQMFPNKSVNKMSILIIVGGSVEEILILCPKYYWLFEMIGLA